MKVSRVGNTFLIWILELLGVGKHPCYFFITKIAKQLLVTIVTAMKLCYDVGNQHVGAHIPRICAPAALFYCLYQSTVSTVTSSKRTTYIHSKYYCELASLRHVNKVRYMYTCNEYTACYKPVDIILWIHVTGIPTGIHTSYVVWMCTHYIHVLHMYLVFVYMPSINSLA